MSGERRDRAKRVNASAAINSPPATVTIGCNTTVDAVNGKSRVFEPGKIGGWGTRNNGQTHP
jgi:hypothetical protein